MNTLQKRLKIARITKDMTQRDLAIAAGVSRATIAMIETEEKRRLRSDTLGKIASALGVTTDYLISGEVEHAH